MKKYLSCLAWLLVLAAGIVAVVIWPKHAADRPECPHSWADADTLFTNHLLIPGVIANVPEYHDCQRFLVKNGNGGLKYDSLEAIFVRYKLDSIYGIFQGREERDTRGAKPSGTAYLSDGFQVVGQVLSYGDYAPLGIKKGNDCLVLKWMTLNHETTYEAWMVGVAEDGDRCKKVPPQLLIQAANQVKLDVALIRTVGAVPPVSRWDWDEGDSLQYIGIACPTGWCEVHSPKPFRSSPLYGGPHDPITKGWYDEQYLATYASHTLVHDGSTFGTAYPDPGLGHQTMVTYTSWQPVAWVALRTASHTYREKLNFNPAPPLSVPLVGLTDKNISRLLNKVELCFVPLGTTGCHSVADPPLPKNCSSDPVNKGTWYARETPPYGVANTSTITCAIFRSYPGDQAPAVVRWRWQKDDETMWISCPSGCCEVKVRQ